MTVVIKAVVFKTSRLKTTKEFFIDELGIELKESSATHFVIHTKNIRLLFIEAANNAAIEIYLKRIHVTKTETIEIKEDPNGIKIIIA